MPNFTDHGYAGGNERERTHVLPYVMDEEDAELLEAMLRRHTGPSMFFKKGMESLKTLLEICLFKTHILRRISMHFIEASFIIWS